MHWFYEKVEFKFRQKKNSILKKTTNIAKMCCYVHLHLILDSRFKNNVIYNALSSQCMSVCKCRLGFWIFCSKKSYPDLREKIVIWLWLYMYCMCSSFRKLIILHFYETIQFIFLSEQNGWKFIFHRHIIFNKICEQTLKHKRKAQWLVRIYTWNKWHYLKIEIIVENEIDTQRKKWIISKKCTQQTFDSCQMIPKFLVKLSHTCQD